MTAIRTQVVPASGVKTAAPALEPLLSEIHEAGRAGRHVRGSEDADALIPNEFHRRASLDLPEITEPQVVRHFTHLAQLNYAVDTGMYPLGSCTMKYNPKVNDRIAALAGFAEIHPRQDDDTIQGALRLLFELQELLAKLTGMDAATLQPAAGAHAEFTALLVFKAYHSKRGDAAKRRRVIVPDTAHGTNPASAAMCGYAVTTVKSDSRGNIDLASLKAALGDDVVGLMLTNPNTLGLFEEHLREVCDAVHNAGGLVYGDRAYMRTLGEDGLAEASNDAILAANYLLAQLRDSYDVAFDRPCMHEFVLSASRQKKQGASALDVAKALIDEGFHPPTVYFPLVVPEALMIEPTETEPRETLDAFAAAMIRIAERAKTDPASVKAAPLHAPLARLDEVTAARNPKLKWQRSI